jgi:hypothetical protein
MGNPTIGDNHEGNSQIGCGIGRDVFGIAFVALTGSAAEAFGNAYSDAEIAAAANFGTARFGSKESSLTLQTVAELRKQTSR